MVCQLCCYKSGFSIEPPQLGCLKGPSSEVQQALEAGVLTKDSIVDDSGCSMTTFNHLKWFTEIYPLNSPIQFSTSDGGTGESSYMGTVEFQASCSNGTVTTMQVSRTLYCPTSPVNLLSSGAMREDGVVRDGLNDKLIHKVTGHELAKIIWINGVAVLPCEPPPDLEEHKEIRQAVLASINYRTMHRRLMHASRDVVIQACKKAGIRIHGIARGTDWSIASEPPRAAMTRVLFVSSRTWLKFGSPVTLIKRYRSREKPSTCRHFAEASAPRASAVTIAVIFRRHILAVF